MLLTVKGYHIMKYLQLLLLLMNVKCGIALDAISFLLTYSTVYV